MNKLYLSALRGLMGDWVYYPCLMSLKDVASRVGFAGELYENESLDNLLQRALKKGRAKDIKNYLLTQEQRFFNSIVVAVYGGEPTWFPVRRIEGDENFDASQVEPQVIESIGILQLRGDETLFALDGQHRLAGIRQAVEENEDLGRDEISVVFIGHEKTVEGKERSRRLFTTLNKHAKKVSKAEIIALDEDDTMAIVVRRLVREYELFLDDRIAATHTDNMPKSNTKALTTLGNLYDILMIIFLSRVAKTTEEKRRLTESRLSDDDLDGYYKRAEDYFTRMTTTFETLKEYSSANKIEAVVGKYRNEQGGDILFRPIGLKIIAELYSKLVKLYDDDDVFEKLSLIPRALSNSPFVGVLWDETRSRMNHKNKSVIVKTLWFMLDEQIDEKEVHQAYAKALGRKVEDVVLPEKLL